VNLLNGTTAVGQYCPDGSCVQINSICPTQGQIFTSVTGCLATQPCSVGNNGIIYLGEDGALGDGHGGVSFLGSSSFMAPASNPCFITIQNNYHHKMQFNMTGINLSAYAFSMFYLSGSRYDKLGSQFVLESGIGSVKLFIGSTTTKPTTAKLIWSEYGYVPGVNPVTPPSTDGTTDPVVTPPTPTPTPTPTEPTSAFSI